MKSLLTFALLAISTATSAATIKVPCATDKAIVKSASFNEVENTTDIKISLFEDSDEFFGNRLLLKTIIYTAEGRLAKSDISTELYIKINAFKGIRICQLNVSLK